MKTLSRRVKKLEEELVKLENAHMIHQKCLDKIVDMLIALIEFDVQKARNRR